MKRKILPSILNADWGAFRDQILMLEQEGCEVVHLDVMDGHFVPNITLGPSIIENLSKGTNVKFDVHLMVSEPEKWVPRYASDRTETILVHPEGVPHVHKVLESIREHGAKPGLALNPGTPLSALDWVGDCLQQLLIMTVNPGFGGQKFMNHMIPKIARARAMLDEMGLEDVCPIEVDGGIDAETACYVMDAGADYLVIGGAIFLEKDPRQAYRDLQSLLKKYE